MTLKEQIAERQEILDAARIERDKLVQLQDTCEHDWEIGGDDGEIRKDCKLCGRVQIFKRYY